jgi:hypothetical protein
VWAKKDIAAYSQIQQNASHLVMQQRLGPQSEEKELSLAPELGIQSREKSGKSLIFVESREDSVAQHLQNHKKEIECSASRRSRRAFLRSSVGGGVIAAVPALQRISGSTDHEEAADSGFDGERKRVMKIMMQRGGEFGKPRLP